MAQNMGGLIFGPATATEAGGRVKLHGAAHTFMMSGETSAGTGSAVADIQVSNIDSPDHDATSGDDNGYWITAGTITLTLGTTITSDGFALAAGWKWARVNLTTLTGTDATVNVYSARSL